MAKQAMMAKTRVWHTLCQLQVMKNGSDIEREQMAKIEKQKKGTLLSNCFSYCHNYLDQKRKCQPVTLLIIAFAFSLLFRLWHSGSEQAGEFSVSLLRI
jgi:hypothetical protein